MRDKQETPDAIFSIFDAATKSTGNNKYVCGPPSHPTVYKIIQMDRKAKLSLPSATTCALLHVSGCYPRRFRLWRSKRIPQHPGAAWNLRHFASQMAGLDVLHGHSTLYSRNSGS